MASLILLSLKASIVLIVFCVGLEAKVQDAIYLFRQPGLLLRSFLSMNVIMPAFALLVAGVFHLKPELEIALFALAISPIPPVLPKKAFRAGGRPSFTIGLFVSSALFSIVYIPCALTLGTALGEPVRMSPGAVASLVLTTVLVPIGAGIATRTVASEFADQIAKPISFVATLVLILGLVFVLFVAWPAIAFIVGNGTIVAILALICFGIGSGELLGGSDSADRAVLALSTASRHPGIALAIVQAVFPDFKQASAAILLYLIINAVATIPYMFWNRQRTSEKLAGQS